MIEARAAGLRLGERDVLAGIDLRLEAQGLVAVTGHSGSGKSSLLHVLSGLRRATSGDILLDGRPLSRYATSALRSMMFSFVFQDHFLVPYLSALENVVAGAAGRRDAVASAARLLDALGLSSKRSQRASSLSGGERQRVAVARALVRHARYVFADEPTAALDRPSAERVFAMLGDAATTRAVILVTHDPDGIALAERVIDMRDGRVSADRRVPRAA